MNYVKSHGVGPRCSKRRMDESSLQALARLTERLTSNLRQIEKWFHNIPILALIADREKILVAGGNWEALGYDPNDLRDMEWRSLLHPDDVLRAQDSYKPGSGSVRIRIRDTRGVWHGYEWFYSGTSSETRDEDSMCIGGLPVTDLDTTIYGAEG